MEVQFQENDIFVENGVRVSVDTNHDKPNKCNVFYNPVMKICRELVLCCLYGHSEQSNHVVKALEAFGATGIGGLQWKKHLGTKVDVTINELNSSACKQIEKHCLGNNLTTSTYTGLKSDGLTVETESQNPAQIEIANCDANVMLHQTQYHFVNLDPYGTAVQFLDATFRTTYNKGVVIVTSTDVAALYGKCSQVTERNYNAYTQKTDYTKELAARIVLGAIVKSAARCNKGITVLYCTAIEHFVQVAVRVERGVQQADKCLNRVRKVIHCQICAEWSVYPNTHTPLDNPFTLLPCSCYERSSGRNAVDLGPMWCGDIFDTEFIALMKLGGEVLKLSPKLRSLLETMSDESKCEKRKVSKEKVELEPECGEVGQKRQLLDQTEKQNHKRRCLDSENGHPLFYIVAAHRKIGDRSLPKLRDVINKLQALGFSASRTHFDPKAIRTDASLQQFTDVIIDM